MSDVAEVAQDEKTDETTVENRLEVAERTLRRSQLHTLRERVHVIERRMHDMEFATEMGAVRDDVNSEEIAEIKTMLQQILAELDGPNRGP